MHKGREVKSPRILDFRAICVTVNAQNEFELLNLLLRA
jgi:hypothetical protein